MKLKRPLRGGELGGDVVAVQRALNRWWEGEPLPLTKVYDVRTRDRMAEFQRRLHITPARGWLGQQTLTLLTPHFDRYGKMRYLKFRVLVPRRSKLGPVVKGGASLLDHSLTHKTSSLPLFPAVDLAWGAGVSLYAPEDMVVDTKDTSARPGEALYATGKSKLRHWIAHIDRDYPLGTRFRKGQFIGKTVDTKLGGGPHGHWAVNAEALLGKGKQLLYGRDGTGPDYTLGAPTIREQLKGLA